MPWTKRPPITAAHPMDQSEAARLLGEPLRDYLMARLKEERAITHAAYYGLKHSFRETYGKRAWRRWFEWIVDEWDLEPYTFDREALRDS